MNRKERRELGISKETGDRVDRLNDPCTLTEAVQIARGVAEDVLADYKRNTATLQIALSLQVEILRELCIKSGTFSEEEFQALYVKRVEEFNKSQKEFFQGGNTKDNDPKMDIVPDDIEVVRE